MIRGGVKEGMNMNRQRGLFGEVRTVTFERPRGSLLKWIGSKFRVAEEISSYFPRAFGTFYEPFLGSGSILATMAPEAGVGSDVFPPLIEIWRTLKTDPCLVKGWYGERWHFAMGGDKQDRYEQIKASYNAKPNGADFLFLCRSCYGGVVRFRKADGYMSTPCGAHRPIPPDAFEKRVDEWHRRIRNCEFCLADYAVVMAQAGPGDLVYCDPPYTHSQTILYGAQEFTLAHLLHVIGECKVRGVYVALSIDGTKRSGTMICDLPIPEGLFEREVLIDCGRSMLKRFQMNGRTLENEVVADRLMLTC
jgi:DNA adenine methylase